MKIERILSYGAVILIAILLIGIIHAYWKVADTHDKLNYAALTAKRNHSLTITNVVDSWGHEAIFERISSDMSIDYILTSRGKDGVLHTKDDIIVVVRDLNKSGIIGRWVGNKSKEFAKGMVEGLKEKSDFKEE